MTQSNDGVSPDVEYFQQAELKQLQNQIRETVARLPEQEQKVVRYHYLQEIAFDDIAVMLGVTKGRISQIHRRALCRLRDALSARSHFDITL